MRQHNWIIYGLLSIWLCAAMPVGWASVETALDLYQQKRYSEAAKAFGAASQQRRLTSSQRANVLYYQADALYRSGQSAKATGLYKQVVALAPNSKAGQYATVALARIEPTPSSVKKSAVGTVANAKPVNNWALKSQQPRKAGQPTQPQNVAAKGVKTLASKPAEKAVAKVAPIVVNKAKPAEKTPKVASATPLTPSKTHYLSKGLYAGMRVRWANQPITYYVERAPKGLKAFSPSYVADTDKAFKQWQAASGSTIKLVAAPTAAQARIVVRWSNQVDKTGQSTEAGTRYTAGYTVPSIANNQLQRMDIRLSTLTLEGAPVKTMYPTALHEIGHALGIMGHSDQPTDVMYPTHSNLTALSKRDVSTVLALYKQPPQICELPFKGLGASELATVDAQRQQALTQLEQQAKKDPSLTLLNQLADAYRREADAQKDPEQKKDWWQKALATLAISEKRYPTDGLTQLNKAVIASQLKQWPVADAAIAKAVTRLPDMAEAHLTMAEIKRVQKQYAEARNALDVFERLATPAELATTRYTGLKKALQQGATTASQKPGSPLASNNKGTNLGKTEGKTGSKLVANVKATPVKANPKANPQTEAYAMVGHATPQAAPALTNPVKSTQDAQLIMVPTRKLPPLAPPSVTPQP
jgi:predicted Zn-dependent protease/Tfp pilus assembly protein PilF